MCSMSMCLIRSPRQLHKTLCAINIDKLLVKKWKANYVKIVKLSLKEATVSIVDRVLI